MNRTPSRPLGPPSAMSERDFALWGVEDIAYIRPVMVGDTPGWGIFSADGNGIGVAEKRETAFAAVIQHDLEPLSVH